MCIRDSGGAEEGRQPRGGFLDGLRRPLRAARVLLRAVRAPVSYTHLRAHETVLDLVCRLLLEKKKTIHTILITML